VTTDPLPWWVHRFPNGTELHARLGPDDPQATLLDRAVSILHDTTHEVLAIAQGQPGCPVLRMMAGGPPVDPARVALIEAAVHAVQQLTAWDLAHPVPGTREPPRDGNQPS
jgi:hypothetical protein